MAKLKGPLFSESASGELGKAIQFICGHFLRAKPTIMWDPSEFQKIQNEKFLEGASKWTNILSDDTKERWKAFKKLLVSDDKCIQEIYRLSGYNLWQLYWLKFGENGWVNYPDPPA